MRYLASFLCLVTGACAGYWAWVLVPSGLYDGWSALLVLSFTVCTLAHWALLGWSVLMPNWEWPGRWMVWAGVMEFGLEVAVIAAVPGIFLFCLYQPGHFLLFGFPFGTIFAGLICFKPPGQTLVDSA